MPDSIVRKQVMLFAFAAITILIIPGRALPSGEWECGVDESQFSIQPIVTCEGTFKVRVVFVTFPDVTAACNDNAALPSWADNLDRFDCN